MKRSVVFQFIMLFLVSGFVGGCAVGNKIDYARVSADFTATGTLAVSVAVHDQRDYVVSGAKMPTFVGLQRGGFGNPFNVSTASGRALAEDMAGIISEALSRKAFKAVPVAVAASDPPDAVLEKMKATRADRMVLLVLKEWKTDTYGNVALIYDVSLKVLDGSGKPLAEKKVDGRDNLGGSAWNPPAVARKAAPEAFKKKIEEMLNSAEVVAALR